MILKQSLRIKIAITILEPQIPQWLLFRSIKLHLNMEERKVSQDLQSLALSHYENPTPENRKSVVAAAASLVDYLVGRFSIPDHPIASREDLKEVGLLGVLEALDGYDPDRGTPFLSDAYSRIRSALVDYLRSIDALPREQRKEMADAQQAIESLRHKLGTEPRTVRLPNT